MSGAPKQQARGGDASGGMDAPKARSAGGMGSRNLNDVWIAIQNINIKIEGMGKDISWLKWIVGVGSTLTIGLLLLLLAR